MPCVNMALSLHATDGPLFAFADSHNYQWTANEDLYAKQPLTYPKNLGNFLLTRFVDIVTVIVFNIKKTDNTLHLAFTDTHTCVFVCTVLRMQRCNPNICRRIFMKSVKNLFSFSIFLKYLAKRRYEFYPRKQEKIFVFFI